MPATITPLQKPKQASRNLTQEIDLEYSALLRPIIEDAIRVNLQQVSGRLALLLVRNAFASEQTRSLVTNILGRQPEMTDEQLNDILDQSADAAKNKITKKTLTCPLIMRPVGVLGLAHIDRRHDARQTILGRTDDSDFA